METRGTQLTVSVALDAVAGSIRGEILEEGFAVRPFSGWLELLNELELWRSEVGSGAARAGGSPRTERKET